MGIGIRTRQEFRYKPSDKKSKRNRISVLLKSRRSIFGFKPFISNEFFYDFAEKNMIKIG